METITQFMALTPSARFLTVNHEQPTGTEKGNFEIIVSTGLTDEYVRYMEQLDNMENKACIA